MRDEPGRVAVVGIGNVLMGDDGFGPHLVAELESRYEQEPEVAVMDAGTPGPELCLSLAGLDALVLVDTVRAAGAPGSLRLYRRDEILAMPDAPRLGPHDPGLRQALLSADLCGGSPPEVLLVGAVPASTELCTGLGPELRAALPAALDAVLRELTRLGLPPRPRATALPHALWWQRQEAAPCTR